MSGPPRSHLTTHVLDASTGRPAAGVEVLLESLAGEKPMPVARGRTDPDGRVDRLGPDELVPGAYRLTFGVGVWFAAAGVESFYPEVAVTFTVEQVPDGTPNHYHVPLLLSPFAYSTYRGS